MNDLIIKDQLTGIEESKAKQIEETFAPMVTMLKSFEAQYTEVMGLEQSPEKCAKAKRLRLDISRVRIEADKLRKEKKDQYLRAGNAIQGVYNILKDAVAEREDALKQIEVYYEKIEAERIEAINADRIAQLGQYDVDGAGMGLGNMPDDVWTNLLSGSKASYDLKKEAEAKAEEQRAAEEKRLQEERKRIEEENKELRAQQEKDRIEREKAEKAAKVAEEKRNAELEKIKKAKIQADNKLREEREKAENERMGREAQKAREESERLAKEEMERVARENAEAAPDKEKLMEWAKALISKVDTLKSEDCISAVKRAAKELTDEASR